MPTLVVLLVAAVVACPIAWLFAEIRGGRALRITLGLLAMLVLTTCVTGLSSVLTRFNYNAWYGGASKNLIDSTIEQVENGNLDRVMGILRRINLDYRPTYENRAHYNEIVDEAVAEMSGEHDLAGTRWNVGPFGRETWAGHWEGDVGFWLVIESYSETLKAGRSGDGSPALSDYQISDDAMTLTFSEEELWRHELTLLNKYEAKHVWRNAETGNVWRTDTMHKLIRATPEQRGFTQVTPSTGH